MPAAPALTISALTRTLASQPDEALSALLRTRPDLLHPVPGDFTGLAVRLQSEVSLRQALHRLDVGTLAALEAAAAGRSIAEELRERLRRLGLLLPVSDSATDAIPGSLPALLAELQTATATAGITPGAPAPEATAAAPMAALVRNAALSAVAELLAEVEHLLEILGETPAATLRTGGIGMRELRRISTVRTGVSRAEDATVGETGWLLELAAASALIHIEVDTGMWRPTETAAQWRRAGRAERHQLLVSGWLLTPRSPLLIRGPHPRARIAPALTQERSRGDAPGLRRRLLELAVGLTTAGPATLYQLDDPDSHLAQHAQRPSMEAGTDEAALAASLTGALAERMHWERPLAGARVTHLLPTTLREAERLGLFALGTITDLGQALMSGEESTPDPAAMAAQLAQTLPPTAETVHIPSDLTVVPTGTPSPALVAGLNILADRETHGPLPTYRISSASLHRALDAGWSPAQVREFLTAHSSAELPPSLRTLLDDAARTWRGVDIGAADSWIRESDPQLRAELLDTPALRGLQLRALTEEVLISPASPRELARTLQQAGFGVRQEQPGDSTSDAGMSDAGISGAKVSGAGGTTAHPHTSDPADWTLSATPWQHSPVRTRSITPASPAEALDAVERLRAGGPPRSGDPTVSLGADVVGLLRTAVRERGTVHLRRVDAHGIERTLRGIPTALNAGRLRLRTGEEETVVLVHRITGVTLDEHEAPGTPLPTAHPSSQ